MERDHELRGGAFNNEADNLRCAVRNYNQPDNRNNNIGFRCAQDPRDAAAVPAPSACVRLSTDGRRVPYRVQIPIPCRETWSRPNSGGSPAGPSRPSPKGPAGRGGVMSRVFKVFVAGPEDVREEKAIALEVIYEVSKLGERFGLFLQPFTHDDGPAGFARQATQEDAPKVDRRVAEANIFIGILWKRLAYKSAVNESGTGDEFDIVLGRHQQGDSVEALLYFRTPPEEMKLDPGPHLQSLLAFKIRVEAELNHREYGSVEEFRYAILLDLVQWLIGEVAATVEGES